MLPPTPAGRASSPAPVARRPRQELKDAALIVFANKQDLPNALPSEAIAEKLGLGSLKSRQWAIFKTSAIKGDGLFDGLDWLVSTLREGKK